MIVTLDYETTYLPAQKYSLTNMSTVDYLLDPRYETIMCAMKKGAGRTECEIGHRYVAHMLASVDWPNVAMLSHNAQFDASILYWKYGYVAGLYLDTVAAIYSGVPEAGIIPDRPDRSHVCRSPGQTKSNQTQRL